MSIYPVYMGLFDPVYWLFSKIMEFLYAFTGSYGLTIILFTLLVRLFLVPLSIKSQKGMLKQQALQDDINEVKRLYPGNVQMQSQLTQEIYKANGVSTSAGCLSSLLPLLLIFPMFTILRKPLEYVVGVSAENIAKISTYLTENQIVTGNAAKYLRTSDIPILSGLRDNSQALAEVVEKGWFKVSQLIDLEFLGIDLGQTPSWRPADLFGPDAKTYWILLILPVLSIAIMFVQMRLAQANMSFNKQTKEEKEREANNPAKSGQTPKDQGAGMMKTMQWTMPAIMLWTMFTIPSALGLYFFVGNLIALAQTVYINELYTKPFRKQLEENRQMNLIRRK